MHLRLYLVALMARMRSADHPGAPGEPIADPSGFVPMKRPPPQNQLKTQRAKLLVHFTAMTDKFMVGLAFIWIGLMIGDMTGGLSPALETLNYVIWAIFVIDFGIKFAIAPHKVLFLRKHWITLVSLFLPAFRILRIFRALAALRALSLLRILASINTGMGALAGAMGRRGLGYVTVITIIVLFGGAAGMYQFEQPSQLVQDGFGNVAASGGGLHSYSDAVWWTAMLMTTIGSQYWPVTTAGRALCFLLSMFSLGVFGYITAALASFFVGQANEDKAAKKTKPDDIQRRMQAVAARLENIARDLDSQTRRPDPDMSSEHNSLSHH